MKYNFRDAIIELIKNEHPFYTNLLANMAKMPNPEIPTTRVCCEKDIIWLEYNPKLLEENSLQVFVAMLVHECEHVAKLFFERRGDRDVQVFNVAQDIAINSYIPNFPDHIVINGQKTEPCTAKNHQTIQGKSTDIPLENSLSEDNYEKLIPYKPKMKHKSYCEQPKGASKTDTEKLKYIAHRTLRDTFSKYGSLPGSLQNQYLSHEKDKVPWQILLRNFVTSNTSSETKRTWSRLSRRFS